MLRIVTDGAVDLPEGWEQKYEICVLPLHVRFGSQTYVAGLTLDEAGFYRLVHETRMIPKTSLPSLLEVQQFYRRIANPGDTILSIHVSGKLSGTFATVQSAAEELKDEFDIQPFDSAGGSVSMAFMAQAARLMDRASASFSQIMKKLEWMREHQAIIFTLDNLEFAQLGGRVTALQNILGSAFRVKPILVVVDGMLEMADRVRTRRRSLDRVIDDIRSRVGNALVNMAVVHANDLESAVEMVERVRNTFNCKQLVMTSLSIPVAANLGPGAIGIVAIPVEEEI